MTCTKNAPMPFFYFFGEIASFGAVVKKTRKGLATFPGTPYDSIDFVLPYGDAYGKPYYLSSDRTP